MSTSPSVTSAAPHGAAGLLSLLARAPDYRRLFFATLVSLMGDWFAFVAVSGLVVEVTGREGMTAVVYAASVLPVFLLSPFAGILGDRVDRKRLLLTVDVLRLFPALGLVGALHLRSAALALACVTLLAALSTFFEPIAEAVVPNVVAPEDLSLAQTALGTLWGSMLFVGAAVGGLVSVAFGREVSFYVNAATFAASALLVLRIRRPLQEALPSVPSSWRSALGDVWRLAKARRVTRALLVTKAGVGLGTGIVGLLPSLAATRFGGGDAATGALLAARGLGALVGPFVARALMREDGRRLFVVCGAAVLLFGAAYWVLPVVPTLPLACACVMVAHMGGGAQWVLSTYGLQMTTADGIRARVLSIDFGLATLSIGVSSLAAGAATEWVGLDRTVWGLATAGLIFGAAWLTWTRGLWTSEEDPLR